MMVRPVARMLVLTTMFLLAAGASMVAVPTEMGCPELDSMVVGRRSSMKTSSWQVLRENYRAQGGLVSAAELKEKANLSDEKGGVANAIQRLQTRLRVYGDVIINEYGKGEWVWPDCGFGSRRRGMDERSLVREQLLNGALDAVEELIVPPVFAERATQCYDISVFLCENCHDVAG